MLLERSEQIFSQGGFEIISKLIVIGNTMRNGQPQHSVFKSLVDILS
jgi:hypothetical protein